MRAIFWLVLGLSSLAFAQSDDKTKMKSAREEIGRMQRELEEQRALLVRILELQQQHYGMLVKMAKGELTASQLTAAQNAAAERAAPAPRTEPAPPPPTPRESVTSKATPKASAPQIALVTGKVRVKGDPSPAWVFVEDVKGRASGSLEIKQQNKQFSPRLAAVPRGTKLLFANYENIFHNVFSVSPGNSFDVGNTRSGEPARPYVTQAPGIIDIFCNIHSKMTASVLVTPGTLLAPVASDGTFRLEDVPVGKRKIGAWAGGQQIAFKEVSVTSDGAQVDFELQRGESSQHKNKHGQSYDSYAE